MSERDEPRLGQVPTPERVEKLIEEVREEDPKLAAILEHVLENLASKDDLLKKLADRLDPPAE